jgi:Trk K+ transport system NAD-binding subunit
MLKSLPAQITTVVGSRRGQRNLRVLGSFFLGLAVLIVVYSVTFHVLMQREGQEHSWITGFYWTLTVMSTLGFGDITFHTDLGRIFSIIVLVSGTIFMLVLLPFTFIEFFYEPWMSAQAAARAPRQLPENTQGHVLITNYDSVTEALIKRLRRYKYRYALLVADIDEALRLHDLGVSVVVGPLDDPKTWSNARVETAALVASTGPDETNTAVAFTARELAPEVPIVASAEDEASVDILHLAGTNSVVRLEEMIGSSFARRTVGGDAVSHVIGSFENLQIAEASAHRTPLVGKTLVENALQAKFGVSVVGVWERGRFEPARPDTMVNDSTVLVLAAASEQLAGYDAVFRIYNVSTAPVVILGGGRVGRATARALDERGIDYRIVEKVAELIRGNAKGIVGTAAELSVLEEAGIREAPAVIITPHNDETNIYLTIYCRQLRPDIQILCRATLERNVATLHRAGADSVLSYASMGASEAMNMLQRRQVLTIAEGLELFEVRVPKKLAGGTIAASALRDKTGCSVVGIRTETGMEIAPSSAATLPPDTEIVLIGTAEAEGRFLRQYGDEARRRRGGQQIETRPKRDLTR